MHIPSKKNIFLWGFMAAGKSRLGKRIAPKLNKSFVDLDQHIVEQEQRSIPEIFEQHGEQAFRNLETKYLQQLAKQNNLIIACGGGTPCFNNNKTFMLNHGIIVFLEVQQEELYDRLWRNKDTRPLIATFEDKAKMETYITNLLNQRMPYYSHAHLSYDNTFPKSDLSDLVQAINSFTE